MALVRKRRIEIVGRSDFQGPGRGSARRSRSCTRRASCTYHDEGEERLYGIAEDAALKAAYYRNTIIHYFISGCIPRGRAAEGRRQGGAGAPRDGRAARPVQARVLLPPARALDREGRGAPRAALPRWRRCCRRARTRCARCSPGPSAVRARAAAPVRRRLLRRRAAAGAHGGRRRQRPEGLRRRSA